MEFVLTSATGLVGIILVLLVVLIIVLAIWLGVNYNNLTKAKIRIDNSWSQISVQLKMRADLVPNLVSTVKGYATHEQETFTRVMEARNRFMHAQTPQAAMESGGEIAGLMGRLFAVAENYPQLKADSNFMQLQNQLAQLEQKIALSRQFYNDAVMLYNRRVMVFPSNIAAGLFSFQQRPYFEISQAESQTPNVQF